MPINLLVVEDDELLAKRIKAHFCEPEFSVEIDPTGGHALALINQQGNAEQQIDIAIVDIVLPEHDGLTIAKEITTLTDIGVIVLSARDSQADRIAGLAQGADDYICKPVDLVELELRVKAVYKRIKGTLSDELEDEYITYGTLRIHPENRTLLNSQGAEIRLTEAEHKVLICLIANAGKATSREKVSEQIGQTDRNPSDRTIDVLIGRLRKKLGDEKEQKLIVTVRGKGYMLSST